MKIKRFILGGFLVAGLIAGLVGKSDASTIVQTSSISFQNTTWASSLSFLKFDSSLGTLSSVTLSITSKVRTIIQLTNTGSTTMENILIKTRIRLRVSPTGLGDTDLTVNAGDFSAGNLAPQAFVRSDPDYAPPYTNGPPYTDPTVPFALDNTSTVAAGYNTPSGFTAFSQPGPLGEMITIPVTATAFTNKDYSGEGTIDQLTYGNADATLTYAYQPVPAPPAAISLGIGGLVGLVGTGANRIRARRRAKKN